MEGDEGVRDDVYEVLVVLLQGNVLGRWGEGGVVGAEEDQLGGLSVSFIKVGGNEGDD